VDVVAIDNRAAGRMAAEALLSNGCTNLLFLGGPETATTTVDRRAGFLDRAAEQGQAAHVHYAGPYTFQAGRDGMTAILANGQRPDGVFCGDDVIATGALAAVRAFGLRVPQDIRLIGVNDMDMAAWDGISLTTVRQPLAGIVDASVELLIALLADPGRKPEARILPCEIVWRDTA
jgi:DNA-binding LacI/PurR family transcriptional regulator